MSGYGESCGGNRVVGKVKFFNEEKGYGFIIPEDNSGDIFVHHTAIQQQGYGRKNLQEDQPVEVVWEQEAKGRRAVTVSPIYQNY